MKMTNIIRDPDDAAKRNWDLIVIGGGIYGAMLAFESAQRGINALLIERDDFGQHTSTNSLRIIHGGLRYLQKLDLHRFQESVQERSWFLKTFPKLVNPLPCLMPLYGTGLKRPSIFRCALVLNDFLSRNRNKDLPPEQSLSKGKIISEQETILLFPSVDTQQLKGGAVWYDAWMPDPQDILMQILLWAREAGATLLNYTEAERLYTETNRVVGLKVKDSVTGKTHKVSAAKIINAAGPWCREIARRFDRDEESLFRPSLAWNVLLNKKPVSSHALAVEPKIKDSRIYFLVPWKGRILAGTRHEPWQSSEKPAPTGQQIQSFLEDLNLAIPGFNLTEKDIIHVYSGLLPAAREGTSILAVRETISDHSKNGGPEGLWTISGVKFTTSRLVAEKTLNLVFPEKGKQPKASRSSQRNHANLLIPSYDWVPSKMDDQTRDAIYEIIKSESVIRAEDLVDRRTCIGDNPRRREFFLREIQGLLMNAS